MLPEGTRVEDRAPITIREDTKGRILLTGLRQVEVNSVDDLLGVLAHGSSIRQTDATAINAKSSRSHAVFSLNLVQRKANHGDKISKRMSMPVDMNQDGFMTVDSKMHFVDLAGSERLKVYKTPLGCACLDTKLTCGNRILMRKAIVQRREFPSMQVLRRLGKSSRNFRPDLLGPMSRTETRSSLDCSKIPWAAMLSPT